MRNPTSTRHQAERAKLIFTIGQQTYAHFTYITFPGDFSQDVSALSHEVSEWMDDPLTNGGNRTPCGILENGDPLETTANFGDSLSVAQLYLSPAG